VSEVVEDEEEVISYLHDRSLTPGTVVALAAAPGHQEPLGAESVKLLVDEREVVIADRVAYALWVVPLS
jgi:hypothetical protein